MLVDRAWFRRALSLLVVATGLGCLSSQQDEALRRKVDQVAVGMTAEQVRAVLGDPDSVLDHSPNTKDQRCWLEYRYLAVSGSSRGWMVCFDERRRVSEEPNFWWVDL